MVFPSLPLYLDPPTWNQQQQIRQPIINSDGVGVGGSSTNLQPPLQQLPPHGGSGSGSAPPPRPNSMAERARLAKIPQPEPALKCPRCDSTNTKFCYFNNYSLSQPRHFCKACRRYWTRGGALRSVPVGGGCRRNKRSSSKSSASKSSADRLAGPSPSNSTATSGSVPPPAPPPPPPQMPFLHPMMDYGSALPSIGLGFHGMQQMEAVDHYQLGSINTSSGMGMEQWRPLSQIHHFPFLGGLEPQPQPLSGLFPFDGAQDTGKTSGPELVSQLASSVKMEDNRPRELNMARQYLGATRNDQFWGGGGGVGAGSSGGGGGSSGVGGGSGGGWMTDLSGFNSSSAGNLL